MRPIVRHPHAVPLLKDMSQVPHTRIAHASLRRPRRCLLIPDDRAAAKDGSSTSRFCQNCSARRPCVSAQTGRVDSRFNLTHRVVTRRTCQPAPMSRNGICTSPYEVNWPKRGPCSGSHRPALAVDISRHSGHTFPASHSSMYRPWPSACGGQRLPLASPWR